MLAGCKPALPVCVSAPLQVDAGVADQLVLGDPKAPRFVYWDKKLRPTPSGEGLMPGFGAPTCC